MMRDVARVLAAMRADCYCIPQLILLDQTIRALIDEFTEHDPNFDAHAFATMARHREGRLVSDELAPDTPTKNQQE